jgi:hypothetical protein
LTVTIVPAATERDVNMKSVLIVIVGPVAVGSEVVVAGAGEGAGAEVAGGVAAEPALPHAATPPAKMATAHKDRKIRCMPGLRSQPPSRPKL